MSSKDKLYEIWGQLAFGNHSIQISTEVTVKLLQLCTVSLLDISIDWCRIWILAGKSRQKIVKEVAALKIDRFMHL